MAKALIFVTGATGFIGSHVVAATLAAGHRVRLSVRREAQIQQLRTRFASHAALVDFVVIPDLASADAVRWALAGVDHVFHIASPMPGTGDDFEADYLEPAVNGTLAVLNAAATAPPPTSVKTVIVVSSVLALIPLGGVRTPGLQVKEYSNPSIVVAPDMAFPAGIEGHALKYQASKVLAHRATVAWADERAPAFRIVTLHPSFVAGPDLAQTQAADPVAFVNGLLMRSLASDKPVIPSGIVDVRDVAEAHLLALLTPSAREEGRRSVAEFLLGGPPCTWDQIAAFVRARYPQVPVKLAPPFDEPFRADTTRAERDLGITWRPVEETVGSVLDQQLKFQSRPAL